MPFVATAITVVLLTVTVDVVSVEAIMWRHKECCINKHRGRVVWQWWGAPTGQQWDVWVVTRMQQLDKHRAEERDVCAREAWHPLTGAQCTSLQCWRGESVGYDTTLSV